MKADKLPSQIVDQREREAKQRKAEELKRIAIAKKAKGNKAGAAKDPHFSQTGFPGTVPGDGKSSQSLEDIMEASQNFNPRELGEVTEKFGTGEDVLAQMPMAECPQKLQTQLLPYQRQALA